MGFLTNWEISEHEQHILSLKQQIAQCTDRQRKGFLKAELIGHQERLKKLKSKK